MFKTNETATDIASSIGNNLTYYANPSGGTIVKVAEYLKEITDMNKIEIDDYDIYLGNITYSVSQLFGSYLGKWALTFLIIKKKLINIYSLQH